jgi:hypothetical protein
VGIERPSSRDHAENFNLDTLAGACIEKFVRLVHPYNWSEWKFN